MLHNLIHSYNTTILVLYYYSKVKHVVINKSNLVFWMTSKNNVFWFNVQWKFIFVTCRGYKICIEIKIY